MPLEYVVAFCRGGEGRGRGIVREAGNRGDDEGGNQ